jgi:hypothetical protein
LQPVLTTLAANFVISSAGIIATGGRMGTISDYWQLKVNLKEKIYLYANSTTQRCPKEIKKTFLIKDSICHLYQRHRR